MRRILSIDGGGIRGIIPARVLAALETAIPGLCSGIFDLVAGTSTGGILACGIGIGKSAEVLAQFYPKYGPSIFRRRLIPTLLRPKYSARGIESALGEVFGSTRFSSAKVKLLIPSRTCEGPVHFKSWENSELLMSEVARATSAAPTYFSPASGSRYVDGGLQANDPSMNAYAEALRLWPGEEVRILSLGTGRAPVRYDDGGRWPTGGLVQWSKLIVPALMDGPEKDTQYMASTILGPRYLRVDGTIVSPAKVGMDCADIGNISALENIGRNLGLSAVEGIRAFLQV